MGFPWEASDFSPDSLMPVETQKKEEELPRQSLNYLGIALFRGCVRAPGSNTAYRRFETKGVGRLIGAKKAYRNSGSSTNCSSRGSSGARSELLGGPREFAKVRIGPSHKSQCRRIFSITNR